MSVICSRCGRDIDAIGQDNVSYTREPVCEDCADRCGDCAHFIGGGDWNLCCRLDWASTTRTASRATGSPTS